MSNFWDMLVKSSEGVDVKVERISVLPVAYADSDFGRSKIEVIFSVPKRKPDGAVRLYECKSAWRRFAEEVGEIKVEVVKAKVVHSYLISNVFSVPRVEETAEGRKIVVNFGSQSFRQQKIFLAPLRVIFLAKDKSTCWVFEQAK